MTAAVKDVMALVEKTAPSCLAESWDNVGLLVGDEQAPVSSVWVALEVTGPLIEAAAAAKVDLLLTHHPVIFSPLKRVTASDATGALVLRLARLGIHALCAHTNLDAAEGGVNDCLAQAVGLREIQPLPGMPCGRLGLLPQPMEPRQAAAWIAGRLAAPRIRMTEPAAAMVERVALVSGAGGDGLEAARLAGAELFLTGEAKYHEALQAREMGLFMVEAGHDSTENVVLKPWLEHLQKQADRVKLQIAFSLAPCATSPYAQAETET